LLVETGLSLQSQQEQWHFQDSWLTVPADHMGSSTFSGGTWRMVPLLVTVLLHCQTSTRNTRAASYCLSGHTGSKFNFYLSLIRTSITAGYNIISDLKDATAVSQLHAWH
jgi:hypothetical protein